MNDHYKRLDPEPIEYMRQGFTREEYIGFCKGNILKYLMRMGHKGNEEEDARKILAYAGYLVGALQERKVVDGL